MINHEPNIVPLVSICMITYNHEQYISEAIEGVLNQDINFPVEFIIADDASSDKTGKIIEKYISNHPNGSLIKYFRHEINLGGLENFSFALNQCQGKYIALCEGDDYWIDKNKLKLQLEFLENNSGYSLVFTNSFIVDVNSKTQDIKLFDQKNLGKNDIWSFYYRIPTGSIFFKNINNIKKYQFPNVLNLDTILFSKLICFGDFKFLDIYSCCYRIHNEGIWSNIQQAEKFKHLLKTQKYLIRSAPPEYLKLAFMGHIRTLYQANNIETIGLNKIKYIIEFYCFRFYLKYMI